MNMTVNIRDVTGGVQTGNGAKQLNNPGMEQTKYEMNIVDLEKKVINIQNIHNKEVLSIKNEYNTKIRAIKKESILWSIFFAVITGISTNFLYDWIKGIS